MQRRAFDVQVEAERRIDAPPGLVYSLISDYERHHPAFLPDAFSNLTLEEGSVGEGTVIGFDLKLGGRSRRIRAHISEPRSGVLQETDLDTGAITTFEVSPEDDASRVRIQTAFASATGIQGWIERRFAPGMLRKLYTEELDNLDAYARRQINDISEPIAQTSSAR